MEVAELLRRVFMRLEARSPYDSSCFCPSRRLHFPCSLEEVPEGTILPDTLRWFLTVVPEDSCSQQAERSPRFSILGTVLELWDEICGSVASTENPGFSLQDCVDHLLDALLPCCLHTLSACALPSHTHSSYSAPN